MSKRPKRERAAKKPANKVTGSEASKVVITGDSYDDPIALVAGVPAINDAKGATDAAAAIITPINQSFILLHVLEQG